MTQILLPVADDQNADQTRWTPTPIWSNTNGSRTAQGVLSPVNPQGDRFQVKLAPFPFRDPPGPGSQKLTVVLGETGTDPVQVTAVLLQGRTPIASQTVTVGPTVPPLSID